MKKLGKKELEFIVYGSSFFGGGGGGSMDEGLELLRIMEEEDPNLTLEMITVDEMPDDDNVVSTMIAALGSPIATKGKTFQDEAVNAVRGMEEEAAFQGKKLEYIYSGEQGGGNTLLPLYAAWKTGKKIIDTDGNGRAVPELNTGLAPVHGIPTSPVVLASEKGDTIVARTQDPMDGESCENIARHMCQVYNQGIGFAAWMMSKKDHLAASAIGQMTLTRIVGEAIKASNAGNIGSRLETIFKASNIPFKMVTPSATIMDVQITSEGGFDNGVTTLKDDKTGEVYKVLCQNENLLVEKDGKVITTIPNIISMIDVTDPNALKAISNSETVVGHKVALTFTKAHQRWYDNPECYGCWKNVMISAGYGNAGDEVDFF